MRRLPTLLATLCPAAILGQAAAEPQKAKPKDTIPAQIRYNRDVRPILAENCFRCHGPDSGARQANLRLDIEQGVLARRGTSGAVVPGHPEKSSALQRVAAGTMPPASFGKKPTPRQVEILRRWIAQGAKYETHWAYQPVVRPAVPIAGRWQSAVGGPKHPTTQRPNDPNPIDAFLLTRMQKEGLHPSPEADRRTLIRRLSLDLTGLPPSVADVHAFLLEKRPDAYERLVDKYLASPHFGERMAVYWLDLVRYADTVGYHGDQDVTVWPYRDWVIKSFNANKPFDAFTREQIAGDLIPGHTTEQLVGSGYNRLAMMSQEGGVQDKEYRAKYAAERVRNLSGTWLGSTMGCCECHDHKYDPFSTRDFYQMEAFFADMKEQGFYGGGFGSGEWGPSIKLPTAAEKATWDALDGQIADAKKQLAAVTGAQLTSGAAKWEASVRTLDAAKRLGWRPLKVTEAASSGGSTMTAQPDGVVFVSGMHPAFDTYTLTIPSPPGRITAIRLEPQGDERLQGDGVSRAGYYWVLSEIEAETRSGASVRPLKFSNALTGGQDEGYPVRAAIDGRIETAWSVGHFTSSAGQSGVFQLSEPVEVPANGQLIVRLKFQTEPRVALGKFRLLASSVDRADMSGQGIPDNVLAAIRKDSAQRTPQETAAILAHYRTLAPETADLRDRLATLETNRSILLGSIPRTPVTKAEAPRTIRILRRGNWMDDSGDIVQPDAPHFLRQIAHTARANRLDLANWIVSKDNPLTARVFVNRLWKLFYGIGLSKDVNDFGVQGEPPVHPELLDWLAAEFMSGSRQTAAGNPTPDAQHPTPWDVKHIVRLMVTARAYRQSSVCTPELLAKDPFNRFYARQSAPRLDAEFIRDVALSAAGMLSPRVGGPSAHPYEPRGYLASLNFPRREWATGAGEDLYRRGLYTFWQRTFLHPSLLAFDAPTREECTCTRTVSNTPMQALTLMNDPTFVEASRVFAERVCARAKGPLFVTTVKDGPLLGRPNVDLGIQFAFDLALSRSPEPAENALLKKLYTRELARYQRYPAAAKQVISEGDWPVPKDMNVAELASWTIVCRAILNLHETITRN